MPVPRVSSGRRLAWVLLACAAAAACRVPEDPARTALRARIKQEARLSSEDVTRLLAEVRQSVAARPVLIKQGTDSRPMTDEERGVVLGMLTESAGAYDEGLRTGGGVVLRGINAPARSDNEEVEAARKLWVNVETFLPQRFEFVYGVRGYGDYAFDLSVAP